MGSTKPLPLCKDTTRKCFARSSVLGAPRCTVLIEAPEAPCAFCKPEAKVTKGKRYEYNPNNAVERENPALFNRCNSRGKEK